MCRQASLRLVLATLWCLALLPSYSPELSRDGCFLPSLLYLLLCSKREDELLRHDRNLSSVLSVWIACETSVCGQFLVCAAVTEKTTQILDLGASVWNRTEIKLVCMFLVFFNLEEMEHQITRTKMQSQLQLIYQH
jgi:hypothetical protein